MLFCDTSQGSKFSNAGVSENDVDLPLYPTDGVIETIQVGQFGNVALDAAAASPMPVEPPVMTATFPCNLPIVVAPDDRLPSSTFS
jgi:hypothetical protein